MKILYIASSCGWGGASVALLNLICGLKKRGHIAIVLFPKGQNKRFCEELDKIGIGYSFADYGLTIYPHTKNPLKFIVRLLRTLKRQYFAKRQVLKLINSFKPDIVHTNVGPLDIALSSCIKTHVPHVWHLREYQDMDFGMTFIPSKSGFLKKIHKNGNFNIAITNGVFSYWNLNSKKDVVIYDGVFSERDRIVSYSKENIILFVGRVERAKGVLDILEPFSKLIVKYSDYKLIIAGSYIEKDIYYKQCIRLVDELGLSNSVTFLGEINNVFEWMSKSKALVVPSRFEGFGFITAEAMRNGCFVIGMDNAGTKEQFDNCFESTGEECAYRFKDKVGLLEGLLYAVEHDTSRQCKLAQSVVMNNYTLEKHCLRVEAYYKRILSCS